MNQKKMIKTFAFAVIAYAGVTVWAMPSVPAIFHSQPPVAPADTDVVYRYLPGEVRDTAARNRELQVFKPQTLTPEIVLLARSYGDSIVLRWSSPDYVGWRYLNRVGVDVLRIDPETGNADTLAAGLKPTPLERFRTLYPETDSVAMMGMGSVYNLERPNPYETRGETGAVGSLYDLHEEQQMQLGVAMLVSEWRPDVANHMAMRWVDRGVKRGKTYSYVVLPSQNDTTTAVMLNPGLIEEFVNSGYRPSVFDAEITDSVSQPNSVQLRWGNTVYSSYEIDRREQGGEWQRLNKSPYVSMLGDEGCVYGDEVPHPGVYEYRILAHDSFGELTENTQTHTVNVGDMVPPRAPEITWINIIRPNEKDPSAEIWAEIHFEKDTLEDDYMGALPLYYHERLTEGKWKPLLDEPVGRNDTVCRVDVTNLVSGMVVVAAYDTAMNVSYGMPQLLRVSDMRAPAPPSGLKATTSADDGTITLTWNALPDEDIDYYEIVFANDSTHEFVAQKYGTTRDTCFVDTVAMDANQKYIYYKVRAIDFSSNIGDFTEMLRVIRPSNVPPSKAHIDSTYVDEHGIFMRWVTGTDAQMAYHYVLRRLESQKDWTLLRRCDADSVKAAGDIIDVHDVPKPSGKSHWVYAVESFNYSDVSSGLSLQYVVGFNNATIFRWPIKLHGDFLGKGNETRLAWELPEGNPPFEGDWYYCVFRQGPEDKSPQFLISAKAGDLSFSDFLLRPGQTAKYYIMIQYPDGRSSEPSNTVTVTAPK